MSEFDRYLERLCMRAGRRLSEDAERELRQHFDEAVAPRVGGGHPVTTAALVGGGTGLLAGSVLALRRRRGQRGGR